MKNAQSVMQAMKKILSEKEESQKPVELPIGSQKGFPFVPPKSENKKPQKRAS